MLPKDDMGQNKATLTCGNCGTKNAASDQFCASCGYSLGSGPTSYATIHSTHNAPTINATIARRITGALQHNALLGGRYRIIQMIGKGGFGAVYKASDERFGTKRTVAIKEISDAQLSAAQKVQAIKDFRNEAELLVELGHPNLPNVSDFFEEQDKAYLVMEFVEGKSLEKLQDDAQGALDEGLVMGWALQLCNVLNYLHTRPQSIVFRDMKPSNVMLTSDGQIKLIDFGIARIFKSAGTKDTTLLGSQGYAPLEQYGRGQSDARSDIYALGATLYDLLTKEVPMDAPSRRIHPQQFMAPRQLNAKLSPATEAIILRAMADEPKDRFQTTSEMYQAIAATGIAIATNTSGGMTLPPFPTQHPLSGQTQTQMQTQMAAPVQPNTNRGGTNWPTQTQVQTPQKPLSRRGFLIGASLVGVGAIGGTAVFLASRSGSGSNQTGTVPAGGTINLTFVYSTEKEAWLKKAITDFNATNARVGSKSIQINAQGQGSVDTKEAILAGKLKPTAWSPASALELNQLITAWNTKNGKDIVYTSGDYIAKPLVFSPLVFGVWKERADILSKKYGKIDWQSIQQALLLSSWGEIGGKSEWGQVKLGQTRPDKSNSGLLSITLMAYAYYKTQRRLTVTQIQDQGFLKYFNDIESAVQLFGRSSGTYLTNEVITKGPAAYDIIPIYENLILTNEKAAKERWQTLQPFYPTLNIVSDHPFAILNGEWVQEEEKEAAKVFRDFLLSKDQQRNALLSGFRPINPEIKITDKSVQGNPFITQEQDIRIPETITNQAQPPSGDVIDELLKQWTNGYGNASTALSNAPTIQGKQSNDTILI